MARSRVLSQSKAVYVTKTGVLQGTSSGVEATQLHRIDNLSFDVDIAGSRQDIREFGKLARIGTLVDSDLNANASIGYLLTDGENEHHLGFQIKDSLTGDFVGNLQGISGFLVEDDDLKERNIFICTVGEGKDAFATESWNDRAEHDVVGLGNAFISDYQVELSVGDIPRADVTFEANNLVFYTGASSGLANPSLGLTDATKIDTGLVALPIPTTGESDVDVLRHGQIELTLESSTPLGIGGADLAEFHPQSVSISVPLAREALERLGNERAYSRPLAFPIDVTLSVSAITADLQAGELSTLLTGCGGQEKRNINVKLKDRCDGTTLRLGYQLRQAVLDSQSFSQDLDGNETVDLQFSAQIGGAGTVTDGFFMTGSYDLAEGSPLNPTMFNQ
jgi:hypothetical protein